MAGGIHGDALQSSAGDAPYPSRAYAWYAIFALIIVTLASLVDRLLPNLLVGDIRKTLQISESDVGYLLGPAFGLINALLYLPFGRLADITNRRNLIVVGSVVWSVMTILCGVADGFWELFAARFGLGAAVSCLAPAAYSLVADYVEPRQRGRALGVFFLALAGGAGFAVFLAGLILPILVAHGTFDFGVLGSFEPWQFFFVLAGGAGLFLSALVLTVREVPRRTNRGASIASDAPKPTIADFLRYLRTHPRVFTHVYAAHAMMSYATVAAFFWAPTVFIRGYNLPTGQAGLIVGGLALTGAISGSLISGVLSDRWLAAGKTGTRFRVTALGYGLCLVGLFWPLMPSLVSSGALFLIYCLGSTIGTASAPPSTQDLVPNAMRGQASAVFLCLNGLAAYGLGVPIVAFITDHVFHDDGALPYSVALACTPAVVIGALVCWLGLKPYDATREAALRAAR